MISILWEDQRLVRLMVVVSLLVPSSGEGYSRSRSRELAHWFDVGLVKHRSLRVDRIHLRLGFRRRVCCSCAEDEQDEVSDQSVILTTSQGLESGCPWDLDREQDENSDLSVILITS